MATANTQFGLLEEIIVDNFAGGGGASTGIEMATGRIIQIAINHDPDAIAMHEANHPYTRHLQASVWDVDPVEVCEGRPVGLAWFSPDCKHFSKAKGSALVDRNIRGLAWIVLRWAGTVRPRVIMLENVEEFITWGPVRKGKPVKKKAGQTFQRWKRQLEDLGYVVEHRELVAADYGAPTTRKRFVLVARCDGKPIVWPERTHAPRDSAEVKEGKCKPWVSAAEIIDWSLPSYSIFASKAEIKEKYGVNAVRPLAENTLKRVIRGVDKFTIKSGKPFLIECNHSGGGHVRSAEDPVNTVTGKFTCGLAESIMAPFTATNTSNSVGAMANQPVHTVTTAGNQLLVSPVLASIGQTGGGDRIRDIQDPVPTVVSKAETCVASAVVSPFMCQQKFDNAPQDIEAPISTITAVGAHSLASANLVQYHTEQQKEGARVADLEKPVQTVDASNRYGLTTAQLVEYYGNGRPLDINEPMRTVTSHDREGLVSAHVQKYFGGVIGADAREPLPTVTAADHNAMCSAHIAEFKGSDIGQAPDRPLRTITASAGEFALVRTKVMKYEAGVHLGYWPKVRELLNKHCGYELKEDEILLLQIYGTWYFISDITLRMLSPRELYNANGAPMDYIIDRVTDGKPYGKAKQVARCGNMVCPPLAEAMVRANFPEWCEGVCISTMEELKKAVAV
ncbi:MAG: DNA cytosine methyltransferase [Oscillospiraceae bacterium]|nr:DNA cytosine methyltransferase [Oscillospiraceae bacterium]